ncbi:hypothetical protein EXIGLDRAFT_758350 [Exidia glandulosa HHB12029]|uniref:DNA replication complex GINS protein PSF3 n=1 Tax=Exidia glandulosa HHB12029 TaxID=1314781 RepID=A0A165QTE6_EXIGL|nr:hypothetical protein EXIGLDRAFT_758350 [Exidia glandulosa HHB12029]
MDNTYFDIDAIFAENQKLACTFLTDVPGLGYLDGGKERDIKKGTKMQLPYWLALPLLYAEHLEFTLPQPFGSRVRNALNADARSVRLASLVGVGNYWYAHGRNVVDILDETQGKPMADVLKDTFKGRLMDLMDQAQHFAGAGTGIGVAHSGTGDAGQEFREGLDQTERELFALAQESARRTKAWFESSDRTTS